MVLKSGLTGNQLKWIALMGMLFDHINAYFGQQLGFPLWFSWVGRFVAPVFLYLLMEGYRYTSNRKAYFNRLFGMSILMTVINIVRNFLTGDYYHPVTKKFDIFRLFSGHNIFQTLTVFFLVFVLVDRFKHTQEVSRYGNLLWLILLMPTILFSEGGLQLLPLALVFVFFDNKKSAMSLALVVTSLFWLGDAVYSYLAYGHAYQTLYQQLTFDNQFMQILALPLLLAYNGKRGGKGTAFEKSVFYIFYPVHFLIIDMFRFYLGS